MAFDNKEQPKTGTAVEVTKKPLQGELNLDVPKENNPFLKGFTVPLKRKRKTLSSDRLALMNMDTGVVENTAEITKHEQYDAEQFLKVFQAQIGVFFGLSAPAIKVLTVAWMEAANEKGKHYIFLSERIAAQHAKAAGHPLSRATYFRGRKELIEAGIIAPSTEPNRYWINPAIFFNGDRVKLVVELEKNPEIAGPGEGFEGEAGDA